MENWNIRENQNGSSELMHYGILGMKWGVRRTPEQLGHHKIKKRTKVYRTTLDPNELETGYAYVSYLDPDRDRSKAFKFSKKKNKFYENSYELKEDLNVPSRKELQDVITNIMKQEKARRDVGEATVSNLLITPRKEWYNEKGELKRDVFKRDYQKIKEEIVNKFVKEIGDRPADVQLNTVIENFPKSSWVRSQVFSELQRRGYNAIVNESIVGETGGASERGGVDPIIVFDRSKSMSKISSKEISEKETKKATQRYMNWRLVANNPSNKKNPW